MALKYKQLWQVERVYRDVKLLLITRTIFHQQARTIRGHAFCSFLALVLRKELDRCLERTGKGFESSEIKQDLKALQSATIEESGRFSTGVILKLTTPPHCGKISTKQQG